MNARIIPQYCALTPIQRDWVDECNTYAVPFFVVDGFGREFVTPPAAWHRVFNAKPLANGRPPVHGAVPVSIIDWLGDLC